MIEAEGLSVRFKHGVARRTLTALDRLDLAIHEGDFFAMLGQNGAGKSTAMSCFLGLLRPTSGRVRVLGRAPVPGSDIYRDIGFLPEEPTYHDYLTIDEALEYYGGLSGKPGWRPRAADLVERLGLAEFRRLRLARCSKGIKQKLGIVQCLLGEPRLLFLDEPMRGLDPLAVREFRDILVERNREGVTIVMNSHILSEVERVATRAAILDRGRLLAQGRLEDLISPCNDDTYTVEVEGGEGLPEYFRPGLGSAGKIEGTVPSKHFYDFLEFTRTRGLRVFGCALRQGTLEDAFLRIVRPLPDA